MSKNSTFDLVMKVENNRLPSPPHSQKSSKSQCMCFCEGKKDQEWGWCKHLNPKRKYPVCGCVGASYFLNSVYCYCLVSLTSAHREPQTLSPKRDLRSSLSPIPPPHTCSGFIEGDTEAQGVLCFSSHSQSGLPRTQAS